MDSEVGDTLRIVVDTNTIVKATLDNQSASATLISACEARHFLLLLSFVVLGEYRRILRHPMFRTRGPRFSDLSISDILDRLRYRADVIDPVSAHFEFDRDPDDAKFIELAIAGRATHIISHDKDLLSLPASRSDAGRRFRQRLPGVRVQDAATFVRDHPRIFRK